MVRAYLVSASFRSLGLNSVTFFCLIGLCLDVILSALNRNFSFRSFAGARAFGINRSVRGAFFLETRFALFRTPGAFIVFLSVFFIQGRFVFLSSRVSTFLLRGVAIGLRTGARLSDALGFIAYPAI